MNERRGFALAGSAWRWVLLSMAVIALDQWMKYLIIENFAEFEDLVLLPVLELMRLHNEGAAFSFLSSAGGWQRWFFIGLGCAVSLVILVWLMRLPGRGKSLLAAGLALVLGGALGNVIDRVRFGYVVDFIRVHYEAWYFPAFNVADSAITVGACLLIIENLLEWGHGEDAHRRARKEARDREA
jgi:signal peptidase II